MYRLQADMTTINCTSIGSNVKLIKPQNISPPKRYTNKTDFDISRRAKKSAQNFRCKDCSFPTTKDLLSYESSNFCIV